MSWDQYSETPASNDLANYFQTGMAPSKVKNASWDIMADLASRFAAMHTSAGTANAQTVTQTRQWASLVNGIELIFLPGFTNTGAVTLAVDGLPAENINANGVAATAGMIAQNIPAHVKYDGTQFNLLNPQRATGSFTLTETGMASGGTGTVNYAIGQDGKTAMVWIVAGISGISNATTMTGTGIPAILTSTIANLGILPILLEDAGIVSLGLITGGLNSTTWTFGKAQSGSPGGFTNSGTKGIPSGVFWSYPLG